MEQIRNNGLRRLFLSSASLNVRHASSFLSSFRFVRDLGVEDTVSHAAYTTPRSFAAAREREKRREKVIFRIFPSFFFLRKLFFFFFVENRLYTAINLTNGTNVTNYIVFRVRSSHDISRNIRCKIERNGHFYLHKESFRMFDTEHRKKEEKVLEDTKDKTSDGIRRQREKRKES